VTFSAIVWRALGRLHGVGARCCGAIEGGKREESMDSDVDEDGVTMSNDNGNDNCSCSWNWLGDVCL